MQLRYITLLAAFYFITGCAEPATDAGMLNEAASLPAAFKFHEQDWKVITSFINRKQGTMSTLYGNEAAFKHATAAAAGSYPPGAALALITWQQQEDKRWYGANIPGKLQTLELVKTAAAGNDTLATYRQYSGAALTPAAQADSVQDNARIKYILSQKASVLP